jgi:hypothetical protein
MATSSSEASPSELVDASPTVSLDSSWAEFIALVRFDDKDGQKIQCLYPPRKDTPENNAFIHDLKMLCMPDCLEFDSAVHELYFMTRIRIETSSSNPHAADMMMNCYVSFRQYPDPGSRRGYFQQSLVIVSKLPYLTLFNRLLHRLADVLSDLPDFEKYDHLSELEMKANDSSYLPYDLTILDSTIEVAYQHFLQWPEPCVGQTLCLPFFGIMVDYEVPITPIYALRQPELRDLWSLQSLLSKHAGVDSHGGIFHHINLVAVFHRLGFLPHLWTLWELVITGKNVVVWSSSAAIASAVVNALISLIAPLAYAGDYRPYINPYDSDSSRLGDVVSGSKAISKASTSASALQVVGLSDDESSGSTSDSGAGPELGPTLFSGPCYIRSIGSENKPTSIIVGITNPFLLKSFAQADAALFIPNPDSINLPESKSRSAASSPKRPKIGSLFRATIFQSSSNSDKAPTVDNSSSSSIKCKPSRKFSALGIGLSMDDTNKASPSHQNSMQSPCNRANAVVPQSPSTSTKPNLAVKVKKLAASESIVDVYDSWIASGGLKIQGSNRHVLLCLRQKPLLTIDPDVESRLNALLSTQTILPADIQTRFQANHVSIGRDSITDDPSDKEVIANMLIREHFRNLTLSMLKPFEKYFHASSQLSVVKKSSSSSSPTVASIMSSMRALSTTVTTATAASNPNSINSTRAGASSMLLYSNPNRYFGIDDVDVAVAQYKRDAELFGYNHVPACLRRCSEWDVLVLRFAESDTFRAWSSWRRDLLVIRMLVDTSRLCQDMSTTGLIEAFMIEQGYEFVTYKHLQELIARIRITIRALEDVDARFHDIAAILFSQPSPTVTVANDDSNATMLELDIPKIVDLMKKHLQDIFHIAETNVITQP